MKAQELPAGFAKLWAAADRPKVWGIKELQATAVADSSEQRHWREAAFVITAYHLCGWKRKASTAVPPNHTHTHKSVHSSMFEPVFMECLLTPANSTLRTIGIFSRTSFLYSCINMLPQPLPSGNKTYYSYLQQKGCPIFFTQLLSALREQGAHRTHQDILLL